eukprot:5501234-Amphidinium_carterae.1
MASGTVRGGLTVFQLYAKTTANGRASQATSRYLKQGRLGQSLQLFGDAKPLQRLSFRQWRIGCYTGRSKSRHTSSNRETGIAKNI